MEHPVTSAKMVAILRLVVVAVMAGAVRSGVTARLVLLAVGVAGCGVSVAMILRSGYGTEPFFVLVHGLSLSTGLSMGMMTAAVSALCLALWLPLRITPGIGTVCDLVLLAVTFDAVLSVLPQPSVVAGRILLLVGGLILYVVCTALYVGVELGSGPCDGLMTGLARRTGWSVALVRGALDATAVIVGWSLGGTVGLGTILVTFGFGPLVQLVIRMAPKQLVERSAWSFVRSGEVQRR